MEAGHYGQSTGSAINIVEQGRKSDPEAALSHFHRMGDVLAQEFLLNRNRANKESA